MRRRFLALAAALPVLLVGCSGANHHSSDPTTSIGGRTAGAPNPDVIPAVITPDYVNAVFAVLNHIYGDATRRLAVSRSVTPAVQDDLRAIFTPPLAVQQMQQAAESLQGPISNVRSSPGDGVTTVRSLLSARPNCIFAETTTDLDAVLKNPVPSAASEYYELVPRSVVSGGQDLNPTPWVIAFNAAFLTPTSIGNKCAT